MYTTTSSLFRAVSGFDLSFLSLAQSFQPNSCRWLGMPACHGKSIIPGLFFVHFEIDLHFHPFFSPPLLNSHFLCSCFLLPTVPLSFPPSSLLRRTYCKRSLPSNFCQRGPTFFTFVFNIFLTYKDLTTCSPVIDVLIFSKRSLTKHIIFLQ